MKQDASADDERVRAQEQQEDGEKRKHRFADTPDVECREPQHEGHLDGEPGAGPGGRQKAEERVPGRGEGCGDREDVVHQESRARDHARRRAEDLGRHDVAAATAGELLDDAPVGGRDEEDGGRHERGQPERQEGVLSQRLERLLRAVGRGGEPVGTQSYPGQKGNQGQAMEQVPVIEVAGAAEQGLPDTAGQPRRSRVLLLQPGYRFGHHGVGHLDP